MVGGRPSSSCRGNNRVLRRSTAVEADDWRLNEISRPVDRRSSRALLRRSPLLLRLHLRVRGPLQEPPRNPVGSFGTCRCTIAGRTLDRSLLSELFEQGARITMDTGGGMAVYRLSSWPERCPRISPDNLLEVSRYWQPVLDRMRVPHETLHAVACAGCGEAWQPDGPVLSLSFGSLSGRSFELLWDGRTALSNDLDTAVIRTLETFCSNSRLAKKYLLRDLPQEVARRLDCRQP